MKATYKEFGKYLRAIANLYAKYGDEPLEEDMQFEKLHKTLCQMHPDFDHGARRIEQLAEIFRQQCEDCGEGWSDPNK